MIWRLIVLGSVLYLSVSCVTKRTWNYELLSATATSSDENLLNVSMQIDRLSFSESGISGTLDWKFDTDETTTVEMFFFRSVSGRDDDYNETPYKIPKQKLSDFIDNYYMDVIHANLGECSNLPEFKRKYVPPWPKGTYILRSCKLTGDGFPYVLPSGYYKLWLQMKGPVEMNVVFVLRLSAKLI